MGDLETRVNARSLYDSPTSRGGVSISVIGGFKSAPNNTSTSKVHINTNTRIGSAQGNSRIVAFRTGSWQSGTDLRLENGTNGLIVGSGGNGGGGGGTAGGGGGNGTSALGIDYPITIVNRGTIRAGGGGGGGGGGGSGRARFRRGFGFGFSQATAYGGGGGGGSGWPAGGGASRGGKMDPYMVLAAAAEANLLVALIAMLMVVLVGAAELVAAVVTVKMALSQDLELV